jgi:hypothetical protein
MGQNAPMQDIARLVVVWAILPLWIAAGVADWACHRRTAIERTSGSAENAFHWALFGQMGLAVVAVALLEITAGVLAIVVLLWLAHEATTWIELRYTVPLREVRPFEQMVHSLMEILPLAMLAALAVGHWDALAAGDFGLRPKRQPWPATDFLVIGAAVAVFNVLPLAEEMMRCRRARPSP